MPLVEPKSVNLEKYTRQIAKLVFKPKKNSQRLLANKAGTGTSKESEKSNSNSETKEESSSRKSSEPASNAPAKTTVFNKGLVGLIAGTGPSNKGSAVIEALVDRGLVRQLDELLQSGQNLEVQIPSFNDVGGNLDQVLSATSKVEVDNLISGMQVNDKVELKEKGDVNLESFGEMKGSETALGWRSEQSIRDVIMSYMGRITYAYNKHLKLEPDLKGKVIIEITIAASGEVTACRVVSSSINNPSFEQELVNVIKSFDFKSIPEGEVTVQNPFIFYRRDV